MTPQEVKDIDHFAYPTPFTYELNELELQPYRTNPKLEEKIRYIFSHPTFTWRETFIDVSESGSRGLVNDMAVRAVAIMRYFLLNPQQFGHKVDNIHMQILIRMWRQVFRHKKFQHKPNNKYLATKMKLLLIENDFIETLIETCESGNYIQKGEDMRKKQGRKEVKRSKGLRDGSPYFEYLCGLD